jgi:hypothetical protein
MLLQRCDPCTDVPISSDARHATLVGPSHTTRYNHARCDAGVLPVRHAGARLPIPRAESSSEDQLQRGGGQIETSALDRRGQRRTDHLGIRKRHRVPGKPADSLCQSNVVQGGCVPGATDGSMPVGSGLLLSAPSQQPSGVDRGGDLSITYVPLAWLSPDAGRLCPLIAQATTSVPPTCHTSIAPVHAPWYIRWQQDRRRFPGHALSVARN